ncbi:hypothetical protein R3P38DRAFT_3292149 [Favolaschia claudopus]|uniref:Uncharacterized protein n=1 Tax=Favolaschia claudopus TaxID=2862362 RepID=A0AAV9ZKV9_9AGAR
MLHSLLAVASFFVLCAASALPLGFVNNVERPTNAKRLALGLPPLPPRRATRVRSAARSMASPLPPGTYSCNVGVTDASTTELLGYLSPPTSGNQYYGTLQPSAAGSLCYPYITARVSSQPGYQEISPATNVAGSFIGTSSSSPSTQRRTTATYSETDVWSFDPVSMELSIVWKNHENGGVRTSVIPNLFYDPTDSAKLSFSGKTQPPKATSRAIKLQVANCVAF